MIGDGPYGGDWGSGDFDFYGVDLSAGETLVAQTRTPVGDLDTTIFVYDAAGGQVAYNDDYGSSLDSRVEFTATAGDRYYVAISGYYVDQYDPFDSGSGDGAGSEGPYNLTITASG